MNRNHRMTAARETTEILRAGYYISASQRRVAVAQMLKQAVAGTALFESGKFQMPSPARAVQTVIRVTDETTLAALARLAAAGDGHVGALNFASAKNPGGGFLGGAEAQEESLARSSGLYSCLLAAPEYYERHRANRSALYLDLVIWSPAVPFIRDDAGTLLEEPFTASIITSPAPNAGAVAANEPVNARLIEPTLRRRAALVLGVAQAQGVRRLVLGAWGCGVFRNDPRLVACVFADWLRPPGAFANVFDSVAFAIFDRSADRPVLRAFEEAFR